MSGYPIAPRTQSGEVAHFIDDDQFSSGQSLDKCGYEIVSLFWHSTKINTPNPYSGNDIHTMAHNDYVRANGVDSLTNQRGMRNDQLFADLTYHGFRWVTIAIQSSQVLSANYWNRIRIFLLYGYPVVLGGVDEATVYDVSLNHCPYSWIRPGVDYSHIVLATGLGLSDELLCRDTANIGTDGRVRVGPRRYRTAGMKLTTATALVPSWLPFPGGL